jgi:uncharacterized phiE125 gp8 family phage protein
VNDFVQNLVMTVPPATEPVSLATAKNHLRVDISTDDDAMISALIIAARMLCEKETRRSFVTRTYELRLNRFPFAYPLAYLPAYSLERMPTSIYGRIHLPKPPLLAVSSITYIDVNGTVQTLDPGQYLVDSGGVTQGVITPSFGAYFPQTRYQIDAVKITFDAGYGDETTVPVVATQAMLLLMGNWYRNREAVTEGSFSELPMGVKALLSTLSWGSYP